MEDESTFGEVFALVRDLRRRCDWDRAQTPVSLRPYLREEVAELEEALASGDEGRIAAELGDLLLHFLFQVDLAEERGAFTFEEVARTLTAKMKRRHPHLYGGGPAGNWEKQKIHERRAHAAPGEAPGVLGHLPLNLQEL